MGREKVSARGKEIRSESSEEEEERSSEEEYGIHVHEKRSKLKLLLPVLKVLVVVLMAILFSKKGPQSSVLGPRGQAPPMKLEIVMMTIWTCLSMCR
jgi:flagellar biosynthesis/type III secretory pathway M-ring protein FliF/YscJ